MIKRTTLFVSSALLGLGSLTMCGHPEDNSDSYETYAIPTARPEQLASTHAKALFADLDGVSLKPCPNGTHTVDPSSVPDSRISKVTLSFCIVIDVASGNTTFEQSYKTGKWGLSVLKNGVPVKEYLVSSGETFLTVQSQPAYSATSFTATLKMTIDFTGKDSTTYFNDATWVETQNGRKMVTFRPFFWIGSSGTDPNSTSGTLALASSEVKVVMKTDIGVFANPLTLSLASSSDRTMIYNWKLSNAASVNYETGTPVSTGENSTPRSYVLMVWDDEECAAAGKWSFVTNKDISATTQDLECAYPSGLSSAETCMIAETTCTGEGEKIATESPQDIAIPASIPAIGKSEKVGCYRVYHVNGEDSSHAITDLQNGKVYGAFAWPVDSSGHVGSRRSGCVFGTPELSPVGSGAKSDTPLSKDCFVATAASGDTSSRAVHYWRVVRDLYLQGTSFKAWYMENGPRLASWLDAHAEYKPAVNVMLSMTGWAIVEMRSQQLKARSFVKEKLIHFTSFLSGIFFSEARAQETAPLPVPNPTPTVAPSSEAAAAQESSSPPALESGVNAWNGTSWTNISFNGGILMPSKDAELYDAFYDKKPMTRFMISQTFRLVDLSGELGLGYGFSYTSLGGTVPKRTPGATADNPDSIVGKTIGFYSIGGFGVVEYRYRHGVSPYLWPRLTIAGGVERFREEQMKPSDFTETDGAEWNPRGVTVIDPMILVRLSIEFALGELGLGDRQALRDGYGANEFALALYGEYTNDLSSKRLSLSGLGVGAGVSLLLP